MRSKIVPTLVLVIVLGACGDVVKATKCCVTEQDCASLGIDDLTPCESGQVCNAGTCEATQCETNAQCDQAAPICRLNVCESTCVAETECAGFPGVTHCGPDAACVECLDNTHCSGAKAVCDTEDNTCRGCERDSECASGVCIEGDGVCADEASLVFVQAGMPNTSQCTRQQPCGTIGFAVGVVSATRNVIRVEGAQITEAAPIAINKPMKIDGATTRIVRPASMPVFTIGTTIAAFGDVTIEGLLLIGGGELVTLNRQSTVRFFNTSVSQGTFTVNASSLSLTAVSLDGSTINCTTGAVKIERSTSLDGVILADACEMRIRRSSFESSADDILDARNGLAVIENNVFIQHNGIADSMLLAPASPGSTFRFNTIVSLDSVDSDGQALFCDSSLAVTSNVFSYRSAHPMGPPSGAFCPSKFSLFDNVAVASHRTGEGNLVAAPSAVFVDRAGRDFHLQTTSAGLGTAETGLGVMDDFDGQARPANPDMGALESN